MRARLVPFTPLHPSLSMALDATALARGEGLTLRLTRFAPPCVSLGKLRRRYPRGLALPAVVRPTGGRAVVHTDDLVISVVGDLKGAFAGSVLAVHKAVAALLARALRACGPRVEIVRSRRRESGELCFDSASLYEMTLDGRKVVGLAQARSRGRFLEQGSIVLDVPPRRLESALAAALRAAGWEVVVRPLDAVETEAAPREAFPLLVPAEAACLAHAPTDGG